MVACTKSEAALKAQFVARRLGTSGRFDVIAAAVKTWESLCLFVIVVLRAHSTDYCGFDTGTADHPGLDLAFVSIV